MNNLLDLCDQRNYLSDSGLETTLIFKVGLDLPAFAAFPLLETERGREAFTHYYEMHLSIAEQYQTGFILDTPTWRANRDWGAGLGFDASDLHRINVAAVRMCQDIRERWRERIPSILVSGVIGPRGDGYKSSLMLEDEAADYHMPQVAAFVESGADLVAGMTLSSTGEAIGVAKAAKVYSMPAIISFSVETDGRLASGHTLEDAVTNVDEATDGSPAFYMVNCAHPTHFSHLFASRPEWASRIRGIRANASRLSHAELDNMTSLDDGDPRDFGVQYRELLSVLPNLLLFGGCCGTDHRHVAAVAATCCTGNKLAG